MRYTMTNKIAIKQLAEAGIQPVNSVKVTMLDGWVGEPPFTDNPVEWNGLRARHMNQSGYAQATRLCSRILHSHITYTGDSKERPMPMNGSRAEANSVLSWNHQSLDSGLRIHCKNKYMYNYIHQRDMYASIHLSCSVCLAIANEPKYGNLFVLHPSILGESCPYHCWSCSEVN